ncbi:hypothetical protein ACYSUO_21735 [Streptomyces sp. UC4497]
MMNKPMMSVDYANTIAAVAPVILLVAVVEMTSNRQRFRTTWQLLVARMERIGSLYAGGRRPSEDEVIEAAHAVVAPLRQTLKEFLVLMYIIGNVFVGLLLLRAEMITLEWLMRGGKGKNETAASFSYLAVTLGFAWITFVPVSLLLGPAIAQSRAILRGLIKSRRFRKDLEAPRPRVDERSPSFE